MSDPIGKGEIEARYAALSERVAAARDTASNDDALREEIAELAALMIAYAHETGSAAQLDAALSLAKAGDETLGSRLSLAERARRLIADRDKL